MFIATATEQVEQILGCCLINQQYKMVLDDIPNLRGDTIDRYFYTATEAETIRVRKYPLVAIDGFTIDGTSYDINDYFIVDKSQTRPRLVPKENASIPVVEANAAGIVITFTAGYGETFNEVPSNLKMAVTMLSAYYYEHRGECSQEDALYNSGAMAIIKRAKAMRV
jgi:uncharacterized phiE125 gp8 family phage protein